MASIFLLAGESSGDKLGALLANELLSRGHEVYGWGGNRMRSVGVQVLQDIAALNVMGFSDVISKMPRIIRLFEKCKSDINHIQPDILILIDFGSFNLRIARWAKGKIEKIVYYSPPKLWASRPRRIKKLKRYCDQVIVLFPFEQAYYHQENLSTEYYGHPLFEVIQTSHDKSDFRNRFQLDNRPIIAILPGSRIQEVSRLLPIFLKSVRDFTHYNICVSATSMTINIIKELLQEYHEATIIEETLYPLLSESEIAIVTSGTATLETALFRVPQVVCYKTTQLNYWLAKAMIRVPYISLVNLIAGKKAVEELIQDRCNIQSVRSNIIRLSDDPIKANIARDYQDIVNQLSLPEITKRTVTAIIG